MCYMAYYESIDSPTQSESALHHPLDASNPSTIDDENLPSINKTKHSKKNIGEEGLVMEAFFNLRSSRSVDRERSKF